MIVDPDTHDRQQAVGHETVPYIQRIKGALKVAQGFPFVGQDFVRSKFCYKI